MDTNTNETQVQPPYSSRKFWFAVGTLAIMVASAVLCGLWPALIPLYPEMVGGQLGVLALYMTGNVSTKWVISKANPLVSFQGESWNDKVASKVAEKVTSKLAPAAPAAATKADTGGEA